MPKYNPPYDKKKLTDRNNNVRGFNINHYHNYGRRSGVSQGQTRGFRISQYHQYGRRRGVTSGQTRGFNINQYHKYGRRKGALHAQTRGFNINQYHNYGRRRGAIHNLRRGFAISQYHQFGRRKGAAADQSRGEEPTITIPEVITPICPDHVGWTSTESPDLFFYISGPWPDKIEFAINEFNRLSPEPVLEVSFDHIQHEGIYSVSLSDYGIKLKPDVEYEFFFAIVLDDIERTSDILTSGAIKYVLMDAQKFQNIQTDNAHFFYATSGYWFDAYACLFKAIQHSQSNSLLKAQHTSLLKQIHLTTVAAANTFVSQ
ncbi:MAG: DUF928 domain-containing protein [Candidatus Magnetomorum sp.]|nr:DUF928 domain-containing protein [Candidatus Magnetomorum sp.]